MLDRTDAGRLIRGSGRQWFANRKSMGAILKDAMTNEAQTMLLLKHSLLSRSRIRAAVYGTE